MAKAATNDEEGAIPAPRANPELEGHEAAERTLLDAFASGRLAHAWLISGPKGIGKATLAYRFARFVLKGEANGGLFGAPQSLRVEPDDPVFRRVKASAHSDLCTVERAFDEKKGKYRGEIVVDDVRNVGGFLSLTPAEGGWRVVVVDSADEMNRNAANALLKVLEEPPRRALLLLVSHAPGRLLPTIRSRCRRLVLQPLDDQRVTGLLTRLRPELAETDAAALARLGEGSVGKALRLAEEGGLELYRETINLLIGLPRLDVAALHGLADRLARPNAENAFETVVELLGWWLARAIRAAAAGNFSEVVEGEAALVSRMLAARGLEHWIKVWENNQELFLRAGGLNLDRKQVVLTAFLALENAFRS